MIANERIISYINSLSTEDTPFLTELEKWALKERVPIIRKETQSFLKMCIRDSSRHTTIPKEAIEACEDLKIMAESEEAGVFLCMAENGKKIFVMGHPEYDRITLGKEYRRDKDKGLDIQVPKNYFPNDDDTQQMCIRDSYWTVTVEIEE